MATGNPSAPFAWAWLGHGVLLLILAGLLPVLVDQVATPEWSEAMAMLGAERFITPIRTVAPECAALAPGCAVVGGLSVLSAGWCLLTRQTWTLQVIAVIHLVILPWATWWGHRVAERTGLGSLTNTVGEIALMLATAGVLIWSMWQIRRIRAGSAP
jgi:hypothetical protein